LKIVIPLIGERSQSPSADESTLIIKPARHR
jgi:hypothetical protein